MLLKPKRTKYLKFHKGRISHNIRDNQTYDSNYQFTIIALEGARISDRIIYTIDSLIKRKLKNDYQKSSSMIRNRLFPHFNVTKKPIETRMGKGKGNINYWMCKIKNGGILIEYNSSSEKYGKLIYKIVNSKLPIKTKLIYRKK